MHHSSDKIGTRKSSREKFSTLIQQVHCSNSDNHQKDKLRTCYSLKYINIHIIEYDIVGASLCEQLLIIKFAKVCKIIAIL